MDDDGSSCLCHRFWRPLRVRQCPTACSSIRVESSDKMWRHTRGSVVPIALLSRAVSSRPRLSPFSFHRVVSGSEFGSDRTHTAAGWTAWGHSSAGAGSARRFESHRIRTPGRGRLASRLSPNSASTDQRHVCDPSFITRRMAPRFGRVGGGRTGYGAVLIRSGSDFRVDFQRDYDSQSPDFGQPLNLVPTA